MRPRSRWIAALTLVPAFLAACSDRLPTGVQPPTTGPLFQISDAGNSAGLPGFYFLSPMVPNPGAFTGTFDANLSPEVRVCQLVGSECGTTVKTFTLTTAEPIEVSVPKGTYGVNWVTKNNPSSLTTNVGYRIEIRVGTRLLGFADLAFVAANKDLGSVAPGTVGEVLGSPVNIKFRIEKGIVGSVTITPPTASIALPGNQTFSVEVRDLHDTVIPNAAVTWSSANAAVATVSPASGGSTTATGVAAGSAVITAVAGGVTASANLTVKGPPAIMTALSNADQTATAGTAVAEPPSVRVTDGGGNPVAGVAVTFTPASDGSVTGSPATTDANGVATAGSWTPSPFVGDVPERVQTVTATAGTLSQTFTARVVAGPAVAVTLLGPQDEFVGGVYVMKGGESQPFTAVVVDHFDNPLFTSPVIHWSTVTGASLATPSPSESQSPAGSPLATTTVVTRRDFVLDGTASLRASLNASIFADAQLSVRSLTPLANDDQIFATQVCTRTIILCVSAAPITVNLLGNDQLGVPAAVVSRFSVRLADGTPAWFNAGETAPLGIASLTVGSDGTLTYTTAGVLPQGGGTFFGVDYELKNTFGTSTGAVVLSILPPPLRVVMKARPSSGQGSDRSV